MPNTNGIVKKRFFPPLCFALCLLFCLSSVFAFRPIEKARAETRTVTVVLDAGHGGIDGGVAGRITKTPESVINLAIVLYLRAYLEERGFCCVLTRATPEGLYGTAERGFKKRDMEKRKQIIQAARPSAVISVHQNAFAASSARRGGQVFYRRDNAAGKLLASHIQSRLNALPPLLAPRAPLAGDYFMLNCTDYPAVIVECGFLSNAEDEKRLVDPAYQKTLAVCIGEGLTSYLTFRSDL